MDEFSGGKPSETKSAAAFNLDHAQQAVDEKTFALLMQEIDFDMQAFAVYQANAQSHASSVAHQKNMWNKKLLDEARTAADAYLDHHVTCLILLERTHGKMSGLPNIYVPVVSLAGPR